jgi:hypothetical protein
VARKIIVLSIHEGITKAMLEVKDGEVVEPDVASFAKGNDRLKEIMEAEFLSLSTEIITECMSKANTVGEFYALAKSIVEGEGDESK